jgi:hypothetical protein
MAANLSITASDVAAVEVREQFTGPVNEAVDAGEVGVLNSSSGKVDLADQDDDSAQQLVGIAIKNANAQNVTTTFVRKGILDLGDALASLDYGAILYLSATAGKIYDSDPGNSIVIGTVEPAWGHTTADKVLRVDL